jgi:hypothetical protein
MLMPLFDGAMSWDCHAGEKVESEKNENRQGRYIMPVRESVVRGVGVTTCEYWIHESQVGKTSFPPKRFKK